MPLPGGTLPFLRWIGGKQKLVKQLADRLPPDFDNHEYHEPFLGAASLFFNRVPQAAHLSDLNSHLIDCYCQVRDKPGLVARHLQRHARENSEEYYYEQRRAYNRGKASPAQAARFIYLNKTCFNGIFRVNRQGAFNVPWGAKSAPALPDEDALQRASQALQRANLEVLDYHDAIGRVQPGGFAYVDPPYPAPINGDSFALYTADRFSLSDHCRLADSIADLDRRGGLFMMSNADVPVVRELYDGFRIDVLPAIRYVTCKNKKRAVQELVITNY